MEKRLFVVGDFNVDILQELSKEPKFGEEHLLNELVFSIGGCAANLAVIASKTGLRPTLVSILGTDFATPFLEKQIAAEGVKGIFLRSKLDNSYSMILVNNKGERAIQSIKNCFEEVSSKKFGRLLLPKVRVGDIVCFSGFYNLENLRPGFEKLLKSVKKKGAVTCFDTSFDPQGIWNINNFLPFIDYLFVNDVELEHIARGANTSKRIDSLFRKGANHIVMKQGGKGATLFVKGFKPEYFPTAKVKVVDTTGAGDSFNAGFALGLMRGWSLGNCIKAGNFVAGRKVQVHGLDAPAPKEVENFIALNNRPTLVVVRNHREMSKLAAQSVIDLIKENPNASIALPTGETPKEMYKLLAQAYRKGKVSFSKARFFALDEYVGLSRDDVNSFANYLDKHFFSKVNASSKNIFLLDGAAKDLKREAKRHEAAIRRIGIDLCILGIAPNGHVAFNEPGCCSYSITRTVMLRPETRAKERKNFSGRQVPKKALTIGLKTIRENSGKILLLASGKNKANAISFSLKSKDFMKWPAVALRPHRNFMVIADKAAAKGV